MQFLSPLSQALKDQDWSRLERQLNLVFPQISPFRSKDGTTKFLLQLKDSNQIETVLIPFHKKFSVCLSSQVGCQVKCEFCFTGTLKNFRQLSFEEIIGQYALAVCLVRKNNPLAPLPNIVLMGQGEPLQNFENVKQALQELMHPTGLYLGPRQITLSTAGHLPGLSRFEELGGINLALSLHAASDELRSMLIPLNRLYPLAEIKRSLMALIPKLKKRQFLTMEYLLLAGVNDHAEAAHELVTFCQGLPVIINLIPFNEYPGGKFKRPKTVVVEYFKQLLVEHRLRVMIRTTKGDEVSAACGQLANQKVDGLSV